MEAQTQVPEAVKKQAERADEIHRQLYPDQYPKTVEQTEKAKETHLPEGAPKPGEPVESLRVERQPKPGEQPRQGGEEGPGESAKPRETRDEPAKPGETKPPVPPPSEDWKQKYETLQGKYNAEVPALHMSVASLQNQVKELLAKSASEEPFKEKPGEKKEETAKKEEDAEDKIVKAFKEEYPDIFEAVAKMITGSKPKGEEKPKVETSPKVEPPPPSAPTSSKATFDFYLNRDVPDWRQVNTDPEFIQFLQAPDPAFPGMTKLQSIQAAYNAADATTVIGHFRDFKAGKKPIRPDHETPPPPLPERVPERELSPEEKFLAPPKGGRAPAGSEPGPAATAQDLAKFYDEARRGLWGPIGEEKFRKEEARLLAALTKKT